MKTNKFGYLSNYSRPRDFKKFIMGKTKDYLKYKHLATFNIIASSRSNGVFVDYNDVSGRYFANAAVENVVIWDLR